jgi:serine/threonine protein kinase
LVVSTPPNWWVKVADFGFAKRLEGSKRGWDSNFGGTNFMAPEARGLAGLEHYTTAVDMWSLGCLAYWLMTLQDLVPWANLVDFLNHNWQISYSELHNRGVSDQAVDFISSLVILEYTERMTAPRALEHAWIRDKALPQFESSSQIGFEESEPFENPLPEFTIDQQGLHEEFDAITETRPPLEPRGSSPGPTRPFYQGIQLHEEQDAALLKPLSISLSATSLASDPGPTTAVMADGETPSSPSAGGREVETKASQLLETTDTLELDQNDAEFRRYSTSDLPIFSESYDSETEIPSIQAMDCLNSAQFELVSDTMEDTEPSLEGAELETQPTKPDDSLPQVAIDPAEGESGNGDQLSQHSSSGADVSIRPLVSPRQRSTDDDSVRAERVPIRAENTSIPLLGRRSPRQYAFANPTASVDEVGRRPSFLFDETLADYSSPNDVRLFTYQRPPFSIVRVATPPTLSRADTLWEDYIRENTLQRSETALESVPQSDAGDIVRSSSAFITRGYVSCRLEELLRGCTKTVHLDHVCRNPDGTFYTVSRNFRCHILPGHSAGHKFTFPGQDDYAEQSDVEIALEQDRHDIFVREGIDLRTYIDVGIREARSGIKRAIRTLEGTTVLLERKGPMPHRHVEVLPQLGMPILHYPSKRGNLLVEILLTGLPALESTHGSAFIASLNLHMPFADAIGCMMVDGRGVVYDGSDRQVGIVVEGSHMKTWGCVVKQNGDIVDKRGRVVGHAESFRNYHLFERFPRIRERTSQRRRHSVQGYGAVLPSRLSSITLREGARRPACHPALG